MTTSFKLLFPENRHFAQKILQSTRAILSFLSHISLLDYLVPDPIFFEQDLRYFLLSHDILFIRGIENFV